MIRAPLGSQLYWEERANRFERAIKEDLDTISEPSKNPVYDPQFWLDHSEYTMRVIVLKYSRGDAISSLSESFSGLLDAWELSNQLSDEICAQEKLNTCRDWVFELSNLNHYNWCFWLVGLALSFDIPDAQWQRLLALIGGEGEDVLLDRIIASRQPNRNVGKKILHKNPYVRLLKAINAPQAQQAELLRDFVQNWYVELARKDKNELWWYIYGDAKKHPLEMGSYFGRWCIEAVAAVKAFDLDDSVCLGHEHYPGDLLRPDGPSTHPLRESEKNKKGFFSQLLGRK